MLLSQFAEVTCIGRNKRYLTDLGYEWEVNEIITVKVEDLQPASTSKVVVICDYCYQEGKIKFINRTFGRLMEGRKKIEKDNCYECRAKKMKETCQLIYGVSNPSYIKEITQASGEKRKMAYEEVKKRFEKKNYELITTDYKNNKQKLEYICREHKDKGIQKIRLTHLKKSGCIECAKEKISNSSSGENNHFWKGGKTTLSKYLRSILTQWKNESMKKNGYSCILTGLKENIQIHHLYSYNKIFDETMDEVNLPLYTSIGEYTEEELEVIVDKMIEIHYRYPLGVCLTKEVHKMFHDQYGTEVCTPENFIQFALEFFNKKINLIYTKGERLKYYLYKKTGDSKYKGVKKQKNKWSSSINHHGKNNFIGSFQFEYDAAKAFNEKVIELRGKNATINLLDENDLTDEYYEYHSLNHEKYYPLQTEGTSRFYGVNLSKNRGNKKDNYVSRISLPNGGRHFVGYFPTELEAAYAFNQDSIKLFGEQARLNFLTEEEMAFAEHCKQFFEHRKNEETIYTCVRYNGHSWTCGFTHEGTFHKVGRFPTDEEAALAYNFYVNKYKLERKLNYVETPSFSEEEISAYFEVDKRYFKHRTNTKSIYSCLRQNQQKKWYVRFTLNKEEIYIGSYLTDKEAAIAYNEYILEHGIDRKLNKIVEDM